MQPQRFAIWTCIFRLAACVTVLLARVALALPDEEAQQTERREAPISKPVILYMRIPGGIIETPFAKSQRLELELAKRARRRASSPADRLALRHERLDIMEELTSLDLDDDARTAYARRYVLELVSACYGGEPKLGLERLDKLRARLRCGSVDALAYAELYSIRMRHSFRICCTGLVGNAREQAWLAHLRQFVREFPETSTTAEALWELGRKSEETGAGDEARKWYSMLASRFSETEEGAIAAGALARLDSVGKVIELRGTAFDGKPLELSDFSGRPVVLHFWCPADRGGEELDILERLYNQFADKELAIISIGLCNFRQEAERQARERPLPWPQLYEERQHFGPLRRQFGIAEYPTIMLLDREHRVVNRQADAARLEAEVTQWLGKPK